MVGCNEHSTFESCGVCSVLLTIRFIVVPPPSPPLNSITTFHSGQRCHPLVPRSASLPRRFHHHLCAARPHSCPSHPRIDSTVLLLMRTHFRSDLQHQHIPEDIY